VVFWNTRRVVVVVVVLVFSCLKFKKKSGRFINYNYK
jgi:hypothetical protein